MTLLLLLLAATIGLLLWRDQGPPWLAGMPGEALLAAAALLALLVLWKGWRRLRAAIRDMND